MIDKNIENLYKGKSLDLKSIITLLEKAKEYFLGVDNVINLPSPITVVGDIHGQFHDLIELFEITGKCPSTNFLFLGDYADRGYQGLETIVLLLSLKLKYPSRIHLLRGNHESRQISKIYGFYDECMRKFGSEKVWAMTNDVYDLLPLAAVVEKKIFCVHGGLSPSITEINQINELNRKAEVPLEGPVCDLMWSDPSNSPEVTGWKINPRGAGYLFGSDISKKFCMNNGLDLICRAHQVVDKGYEFAHLKKETIEKNCKGYVVTVFSAPNYCYRCGNKAGIMEIGDDLNLNFSQFEPSPVRNQVNISFASDLLEEKRFDKIQEKSFINTNEYFI